MSPLQLLMSLLLFSDLLLLSSANSITLSLSRLPTTNPHESLNHHAAASKLARAYNLKHPDAHVSLYPNTYSGGHFAFLSFGTPGQNLSFLMDTGSSLVWFPCTRGYKCTNCSSANPNPPRIRTFIPELSYSVKKISCKTQYCKLPDAYRLQCKTPDNKCEYFIENGMGNTTGSLLLETLNSVDSVRNFYVGCSVSSASEPGGVVGFGPGPVSFPAQLNLASFSYCLVSQLYDADVSSDLVLTTSKSGCKDYFAANYTPLFSHPVFPHYYYISLQSISIGNVSVKVPTKYLGPDAKGKGGTVVDSGTAFTQLEQSMFYLVFGELERQVGKTYKRLPKVEKNLNLTLCYDVKKDPTKLPKFTFNFQGNTKMDLPLYNYFPNYSESIHCMTILNSGKLERGPAIVLGNFQQQNFYMKYDLECNRLGIFQQTCK